jgi:hypothetical protein
MLRAGQVEVVFEDAVASFLKTAGQGDLIRLILKIELNGGCIGERASRTWAGTVGVSCFIFRNIS